MPSGLFVSFMTGKYRGRIEDTREQYLAQRHYFGLLCHSAPLFHVLGNHDGENDQPGGPGHLRVKVTGDRAVIDYVQSSLPSYDTQSRKNSEISYSYSIH